MKQHIIFSVYRKEKSDEQNQLNFAQAKRALDKGDIEYKEIAGFYEGLHEKGFIVNAKHVGLVYALCETYHQDSYMLLDNIERNGHRKAYIATFNDSYSGAELNYIGWLHPITVDESKYFDAWTYRPDLNQYYAVSVLDANVVPMQEARA